MHTTFVRSALYWDIYAENSGISLAMFRDNLSVPSPRDALKTGPIGCPETSVRKHHYALRNIPEQLISDLFRVRSLK